MLMSDDLADGRHVTQSDYAELSRLVIEAAWRVDLGRPETLYQLFTDDGQLELGESTLCGKAAIRAWGEDLTKAGTFGTIRHICSNMRFAAISDDAARGVTVLTVFMEQGDGVGSSVPWVVGEDHDHFVRTADGWRISSRRWKQLFIRERL